MSCIKKSRSTFLLISILVLVAPDLWAADDKLMTPLMSEVWIDSQGLNAHFNYKKSSYAVNHDRLAENLIWAHFIHLRDSSIVNKDNFPDGQNIRAFMDNLGAHGINYSLGSDWRQKPQDIQKHLDQLSDEEIAHLDFIEIGQNEPDGGHADSDWATKVVTAMHMQHQIIRADHRFDHVPLLAAPLANSAKTVEEVAAAAALGLSLESLVDAANIHTGGCWHAPENPKASYAKALTEVRVGYPNLPVWVTEYGGNDDPDGNGCYMPPFIQAIYQPRVIAHGLELGYSRLYHYQAADMPTDPMFGATGWFDQNGQAKPVAYALAHINDLMNDPGPNFSPHPIKLSLSPVSGLHELLFQARNGQYRLMLWLDQEVWDLKSLSTSFPTQSVTIAFPNNIQTLKLYATDRLCNIGYTALRFPQRSGGEDLPLARSPDAVPSGPPVCWQYNAHAVPLHQNVATITVGPAIEILEF